MLIGQFTAAPRELIHAASASINAAASRMLQALSRTRQWTTAMATMEEPSRMLQLRPFVVVASVVMVRQQVPLPTSCCHGGANIHDRLISHRISSHRSIKDVDTFLQRKLDVSLLLIIYLSIYYL
jgi:hypothetical protein